MDYLGRLIVTQGEGVGKPFHVLPWEARFVRGAFRAGVGEAALTVSRGAGKTTLVAGIGCAYLDGEDIGSPASEVIIVATTRKQGKKTFAHVKRFLQNAGRLARYRVQDTANDASLESRTDGRRLEVLGANPGGLHGAAPALVLADEVAQWPPTKVDAMLAALRTSLGKVPDSRMVMLGTRAAVDGHPFEVALRTADYRQIHAARPDDPITHKRTWIRANPSLPYFPHLEAETRRAAKRAKRDPAELAQFRALRLNLGVADIVESVLLDPGVWRDSVGDADRAGGYVLGLDLGTTAAMSGAAGYWLDTGRLEALAAFGDDPTLEARGLRDGVGGLYRECHARGELLTSPGRVSDLRQLLGEVWDRWGKPVAIACDRWRSGELRDALKALGWPVVRLKERGMGYKDGGEDVRGFRRAFLEGKVTPVESLLLTAAMAEARTISDPAGNSKLAKKTEGGRRSLARDDAAAAAILAVAVGYRRLQSGNTTERSGIRTHRVG